MTFYSRSSQCAFPIFPSYNAAMEVTEKALLQSSNSAMLTGFWFPMLEEMEWPGMNHRNFLVRLLTGPPNWSGPYISCLTII